MKTPCAALLLSLALCGCGVARKPAAAFDAEPEVIRAVGDWDDLDAAVLAGAIKNEMGPLDWGSHEDSPRVFTMIASNDEPVVVHAWREGEEIVLNAKVGHFGDDVREARLLKTIAARLLTLRGRDEVELPGYP